MRIAALALVGAGVLVLAGCAPGAAPTEKPTPKATAVFSSDAAALKAAEAAYRTYLGVSDRVLIDGGKHPDVLRTVSTGPALKADLEGASEFVKRGWRSSGNTAVTNFKLERRGSTAKEAVVAYACDDVSAVDVVDASGQSAVSSDRPDESPVEVTFVLQGSKLLVGDVKTWSGGGVCSSN
jgi:hypothetical protein